MTVPGFDSRGLIPPYLGHATAPDRSPYEATTEELVGSLGGSPARKKLLLGLLEYRELLGQLGYTDGLQFIDGSFVEDVEKREGRSPNDIDVFSFLVRPAHYQSDPNLWASKGRVEWRNEIIDFTRNKTRFGLDTYAIAIDEVGPYGCIMGTVYWYSLFSHKRTTHDWKGFLQVRLNSADDIKARAAL